MVYKRKDTPEQKAFWQSIEDAAEDAAFEVEETKVLNLPHTRFSCYRKGFEAGYRQRDEEDLKCILKGGE